LKYFVTGLGDCEMNTAGSDEKFKAFTSFLFHFLLLFYELQMENKHALLFHHFDLTFDKKNKYPCESTY
jgi:hypothetical protein